MGSKFSLFRRTAPFVLAAPLLAAWISLLWKKVGLYGPEAGAAIIALLFALLALGVLVAMGLFLNRREEALTAERAERSRLADIIESMDDAIAGVTSEGTITDWNQGARRLYGYERAQALGMPYSSLIPPESRHELSLAMEMIRVGVTRVPLEQTHVRKDGSGVAVSIVASPVLVDGRMVAISLASRDVSQLREKQERLKRALEERGLLIKEIHHRVKNNLQIVASLLNLQIGQIDEPRARAALTETQGRIMSISLVHETLHRSESLSQVNLRHYLGELVASVAQSTVAGTAVEWVVDLPSIDVDLDLAVDCGLIVNELLTNAAKHAFRGRAAGRVRVAVSREEDRLSLRVSDDGVGCDGVVDLENAKTLGMRLISALTRQLGATLSISSNGGMEFHLSIPM